MEKKFTPGPWTYSEYWIWRPSQQVDQPIKQPQIAYIGYDQDNNKKMSEEQIANAHLMASAPNMLDILEEICTVIENCAEDEILGNTNKVLEHRKKLLTIHSKAQLVIAKAYGQQ